jgi:hypothetical protein
MFEFLAHGDEQKPEFCPNCNNTLSLERNIVGGRITKCHDPEVLKEALKKRSADHTSAHVKREAGHRGTLPPDFGRRKSS